MPTVQRSPIQAPNAVSTNAGAENSEPVTKPGCDCFLQACFFAVENNGNGYASAGFETDQQKERPLDRNPRFYRERQLSRSGGAVASRIFLLAKANLSTKIST
jgi:hypothetical protein